MSNFSTDCISRADIYKTPSILPSSNITACQTSAQTSFCWPPNGTRICVPTSGIPFYWPKSSYDASSKVSLQYDLSSQLLLVRNNTGNTTQDFTSYMYDAKAESIPGKSNEKSMKMYMRERMFKEGVDPLNLKTHDGPTIILVKTAEFATSTRASAWATSTAKPYTSKNSKDSGHTHLSGGAVAGVVIGGLVAVIMFAFWIKVCCGVWVCCPTLTGGGKPTRRTIDDEEKKRIVDQGMELMEGGGGGRSVGMRGDEEALMGTRRHEDEMAMLAHGRGVGVPPGYAS